MHPNDVIVIVQEGEYPCCPYCHLFTRSAGPKHFVTKTCQTQTACIEEWEHVARQARLLRLMM
jgi:tRNA(Ile2) C34 agmatinyltransferase TiaS